MPSWVVAVPRHRWSYRIAGTLLAWLCFCFAPVQAATPHTFLAVGDSKTTGVCGLPCWHLDGYEVPLVADLEKDTGYEWREAQPRLGHNGATLADLLHQFGSDAARVRSILDFILISIGSNDVRRNFSGADYAAWRDNLQRYVQLWHTVFPTARIGIAYPRNYAGYSDADFAPMDAAIDRVLASEPYTFAGPHEVTFLRAHSVDGVHPTPEGYAILAQLWTEVIRQLSV